MGRKNCCGNNVVKTSKHCRKYTIASRNPFDVGVVTAQDDGTYLVLLSGNYRGEVDVDADGLPDWVGLGERPCRKYRSLSTKNLVHLWNTVLNNCPYNCNEGVSYKTLCPNALLTYNLVNDDSNCCAVEVKSASIESDGRGNILSLTVKHLNSEDGDSLDHIASRIFNVNVVIDGLRIPH